MKYTEKSEMANILGLGLGKSIARYRKEKKITQAVLVEVIAVDSETISRFERGTALPSLLRLFEIAQALDVGVGDLLTEASPLPQDTKQAVARMLDEISPEDQKLLAQIARLLWERK